MIWVARVATNLLPFEYPFSKTYGVINYSRSSRKDVVSQCWEFEGHLLIQNFPKMKFCSWWSDSENLPVHLCFVLHLFRLLLRRHHPYGPKLFVQRGSHWTGTGYGTIQHTINDRQFIIQSSLKAQGNNMPSWQIYIHTADLFFVFLNKVILKTHSKTNSTARSQDSESLAAKQIWVLHMYIFRLKLLILRRRKQS